MAFTFNRRQAMQAGAAAGAMAAAGPALGAAHAKPKKGGTLRMGIAGANTSDSWDGRTHSDSFMIMMGHGTVFDCLTEVKADGSLAGGVKMANGTNSIKGTPFRHPRQWQRAMHPNRPSILLARHH